MTQDPIPPNLENTGGTEPKTETLPTDQRPERSTKRTLEEIQIAWQTSWQFKAIEWLKACAGLAAIVGLVIAFIASSRQIRQLAESRDDERFDKAVARLGSPNRSERLTGLAGVQLFLEPAQKGRHEAALLALANAVAIEKDATVRSAMLDTFQSLRQYQIGGNVLNEILATERDRNRGILKNLKSEFQSRLKEKGALIFEKGNDEIGLGKRETAELEPLEATAAAIASLVRNGAYVRDFTDIYCVSCVFSSSDHSVNLSKTKFDRSYIRAANFAKVNLENASFESADLLNTDFTSANLRRAKLTAPPFIEPPIQAVLIQKALWAAIGPIFECADLSEADFTGSTVFGFYWTDVNGAGYFPRFFGANVNHTKLDSFTVFTAVPVQVATRDKPTIGPDDIFTVNSEVGRFNVVVEGWNKMRYLVNTHEIGPNFQFTKPIPPEMWRSVYAGLNSLRSAKNVFEAQLPAGLKAFMLANDKMLSRPVISTTCPNAPPA